MRQGLLSVRRMPCAMTVEQAKLEHMLRDIERDNVSGSVRISKKTAILVEEAARYAEENGLDVQKEVARWAGAAAHAHPFMALVRTVGSRLGFLARTESIGKLGLF